LSTFILFNLTINYCHKGWWETKSINKHDCRGSSRVTHQKFHIGPTGVVKEKTTIGKPCNKQRNTDNCMRKTKTENLIKYLVDENFRTRIISNTTRKRS